MTLSRRPLLQAAALAACCATWSVARAQDYPVRPVAVVVPFAAGGATDLLARVVSRAMEKYTGQPFLVENLGGAGATLGTAKVAAALPDGYTLLLGGSSALVMAPHLFNALKYDPFKSFEPISRFASAPYVLVSRADSKFQSYADLIAFGAKNPDKLNYGTPGEGSALHLTIELMLAGAKFSATHIPYRGSAPAWTALLAGDVDFIIDTPSGALPMISAGKAKALAVTSAKRLAEFPDTKTIDELGQKGFESEAWFAMMAPKGTPIPVLNRLRKAATQVLSDPEVRKTLESSRFTPTSPDETNLDAVIRREHNKWGSIIKDRGIQLK